MKLTVEFPSVSYRWGPEGVVILGHPLNSFWDTHDFGIGNSLSVIGAQSSRKLSHEITVLVGR